MTKWLTVVVAAMLALANGVRADDPKKDDPKPDRPATGALAKLLPEVLFKKLDADGDGKITKDEFKKLGEMISQFGQGKLKDNPGLMEKILDKMFERLDADGDGKLTEEEFKKLGEGLGKLGGGKFDPEQLKKLRDRIKGDK
jgi:EF-hand domain pair